MSSIKTTARQAGVLYLLSAITGVFSLLYIPSKFIVPGDATATARNIVAGELTYRMGIFSGLVSSILFLFMVLSLYNLLKDVDRKQARLMVTLVAVMVAAGVASLLNQIAPLILLSGADYLSVFTKPQLDALALGFLKLDNSLAFVAMAFWALWLFPFGILVIRSGFFPKLLGVLLIVGCFAYLAVSFTGIVFPAYRQVVDQVMLPFYAIGELAMIFWLLIKGARVPDGIKHDA
jgi:hypothetical protein